MSVLGSCPRVLVVDDEPIIAQLIADVLSGDGYEVDTAPDGLAALELIGRRAYDLVLSDLRMPELDGLGLYRELQQSRPDLARRFVFITGTSEHTDYQGLIVDIAAPVLTKPFDMAELQRVARETLTVPIA
jgi:two-component system NtrC family sensor kinase